MIWASSQERPLVPNKPWACPPRHKHFLSSSPPITHYDTHLPSDLKASSPSSLSPSFPVPENSRSRTDAENSCSRCLRGICRPLPVDLPRFLPCRFLVVDVVFTHALRTHALPGKIVLDFVGSFSLTFLSRFTTSSTISLPYRLRFHHADAPAAVIGLWRRIGSPSQGAILLDLSRSFPLTPVRPVVYHSPTILPESSIPCHVRMPLVHITHSLQLIPHT